MSRGRMEAFSDGVLAIVITIMVLKLNAPERFNFGCGKEVFPDIFSIYSKFYLCGDILGKPSSFN